VLEAMAAFDPKSRSGAVCDNLIAGAVCPSKSGEYMPVTSPSTGEEIGKVALSGPADVDEAVKAAQIAYPKWSGLTMKARAAIMFKFHHLLGEHAEELAELIVLENGKNKTEALADVAKGNETVEWACGMPQLALGNVMEVSRGITCHDFRDSIGVVGCIVPFNFPCMVPMWTTPIALVAGNCVILKPSEKVPLTMQRVAQLMKQAGIPEGVFQMVNGAVPVVEAICDHPQIKAVTFVGSSKVAELVAKRCRNLNKRVLALGGAKNHLVALPDCDLASCASDITVSFCGCAGQRCMAASVLQLVGGEQQELLDKVVALAGALKPGTGAGEMGGVIDIASRDRIVGLIGQSEKYGSKILLDGRKWSERAGSWVGPTIILAKDANDPLLNVEVFGPLITVLRVPSWEESIALENSNEWGNAACIYTTVGAHAEWFQQRFRAGMIGVNIGVPVPREPFAFGGLYPSLSKFGDMDITGQGAMEFFTTRRKVTTKWGAPSPAAPVKAAVTGDAADAASFAGKM